MLTNFTIRDFKRFDTVEIDLGSPVLFVGTNNSGKSSAMQALILWGIGIKRWNAPIRSGNDRASQSTDGICFPFPVCG